MPDGSHLLRMTRAKMDQATEALEIDPLNGAPAKVVLRSSDADIRSANWGADGRRVFLTRGTGALIESVSVDGGTPSILFAAPQGLRVSDIGPTLPDGRLLVVMIRPVSGDPRSSSTQAVWEIRTDSAGKAVGDPRQVSDWHHDSLEEISASADGKRIAFLRTSTQGDAYTAAFDSAAGLLDTPKRLTLDDRNDYATAWTPDSTTVIFNSDRNGTVDVFKQRLDSHTAELFVGGPGDQGGPRVTSDGRWILYGDHLPNRPSRIMRISLEGGISEPLLTLPNSGGCHCAMRGRCVVLEARGSEWIISAIDAVGGKGRELFRMPTSSGGASLLPDGDHFAFIVPERTGPMNQIRILSSRGEPPRDVTVQNAARLISLDWLPSGAGFFSHDTGSGRPRLLFITMEGQLRVVWVPTDLALESAIPSPDGKHVAINVTKRWSNAWSMTGL